MHSWDWLEPWEQIHIDYAGPFLGHMFLIMIDAHSEWMEVEVVHSPTSQATIEHLKNQFLLDLDSPRQLSQMMAPVLPAVSLLNSHS